MLAVPSSSGAARTTCDQDGLRRCNVIGIGHIQNTSCTIAATRDSSASIMATLALDTLAIARKLKAAGFSDDQAEAVTGVLRDVRDTDLSMLVTKPDLKTEIAEAKYDILKWVLSAIGFQTIVIVGAIITLARGLH